MFYARSAKAKAALGATLIALTNLCWAAGDSSGLNGVDRVGVAGIDGMGVAGIDGMGIAGIDGMGIAGIDGMGTAGIDGMGMVLVGPVDSIDAMNGVFHSMGQVVMASQDMLAGMRVGDLVSVEGTVVASGWLYADGVSQSNQRYVAGATEVFVTGMLNSINRGDGTARMGGLTIDYTSSLGRTTAPQGAMWSFRGTVPTAQGVMLAN